MIEISEVLMLKPDGTTRGFALDWTPAEPMPALDADRVLAIADEGA